MQSFDKPGVKANNGIKRQSFFKIKVFVHTTYSIKEEAMFLLHSSLYNCL